MTDSCELCGRGVVKKTLTPYYWPYDVVCERSRCKSAAEDALLALLESRETTDNLIGTIAGRRKEHYAPVAYRSDTMCQIDIIEDGKWWANQVVKTV